MLPSLNPKKMQAMMKQLGINQEEINAERVVIEKQNSRIIIENPSIQKIKMQGQENWQISGEAREENLEEKISAEDIKMVSEKTGKTESEAKKVLDDCNGDIAEAIMKLSE